METTSATNPKREGEFWVTLLKGETESSLEN